MNTNLNQRISVIKRRLIAVGLSASTAWAVAAGALLLLLSMWLDLVLELPPAVRIACGVACLALAVVMAGLLIRSAWHRVTPAAIARRLDGAAGAHGQVVSGVDLLLSPPMATHGASAVTSGLARMAVERAAALAANVSSAVAAPARPLYRPVAALAVLVLFAMITAAAAPRLFSTQWLRFFDPFGDHPPYSRIEFTLDPGNARVVYGSTLDIRATSHGDTVEGLDLVVKSQEAGTEEVLPMFPEAAGSWRGTLTRVTSDGRYFVRARGARSKHFDIGVITVPKLESVRFRITPPAYTHRPPLEGPLPQGGLAALPGTLVHIWAKSNRPLSAGALETDAPQGVASGAVPSTQPIASTQFTLQPAAAGDTEVGGSFIVQAGGRLSLKVSDVNGQASTDSFTTPITLLRDERPFVRILEPKPDSYATPDVTLNVEMIAEDDYGVSRLELFRSLDESPASSVILPVPKPEPTRFPTTTPLPLAAYALSPGNVIKLYARVEDNDPAGPKGSESPVVTVHIISKEQMQQMMLAREGLEVLLGKYEQATRRMEAANEKIEQLQKALAKADSNSELSKELREQLKQAADQIAKDAEKLAGLSAEDLPFDIDHALKNQLDEAAQALEKAADALDKAAARPGLSAGAAAAAVAKARKELGGEREKFKEEAADPLDHLAKIYPLIEDEARFAELWERQKDLADRMESLVGHDDEDDPHQKSRMRDLEAEQRQLKADLRELLDDIENRTAELPSDPRLDGLRKTAGEFAKAVRKSTAADEMAASESGLAEFSGSRSAPAARAAADTLKKFLAQCQSVGEQGGECLKFQPKLASSLGGTVEQLLEAEGLGMGKGQKGLAGAGGGYSARRSSLRNVGMYGRIPVRGSESRAGGGRADHGISDTSNGPGHAGNPLDSSAKSRLDASGQSDAAIPDRYKRRVGEYFQRVADELEQNGK